MYKYIKEKRANDRYPTIIDFATVLVYNQAEDNNPEADHIENSAEGIANHKAFLKENYPFKNSMPREHVYFEEEMDENEMIEENANEETRILTDQEDLNEVPITPTYNDLFLIENREKLRNAFILLASAECPNQDVRKIEIHNFTMFGNSSPHGYVQILIREASGSHAGRLGTLSFWFILCYCFFIFNN